MSDEKKKVVNEEDIPDIDEFEENELPDDISDEEYNDMADYYQPDELLAACLTVACELNKIRRKHHEDDKAFEEVKKTFDMIMERLRSPEEQ